MLFAGEKVRETDLMAVPEIDAVELMPNARTLPLEKLVRMKLTSYRLKDRVHLLDMISIDLIDETWPQRYPDELGQRLQALLDDPEG